ncbi:MAG: GGDEF domain-containing protein [Rhodocyclaceae bacterium]|nr:GGDEF domain-containing protein [Rhodocyclaceae bacterium]
MVRLLHHIDIITRQRNRSELAVCLVAALAELVDARRVSLYKAFPSPGDILIGLVAEADPQGARSYDDGVSWPDGTGSIERFPHLRARLSEGASWIKITPESAHQIFDIRRGDGELFGFVDLLTARPLDPAQVALVEGLLGLLRNCLALLDYSETDTLTGLLNRKTFDQYLLDILLRISSDGDDAAGMTHLPKRRQSRPRGHHHWLGVMDVDHFKSINDRFGHLIGDEVLILIANMMKASFRAQDQLFRFGGEEFVILLKPTGLEHARATFDRFRQDVEEHLFPQVGHVTISIGFTGISVEDTPAEVLGNADEALYWAKQHGRNQTCSYEELRATDNLHPHPVLHTEVEMFNAPPSATQ